MEPDGANNHREMEESKMGDGNRKSYGSGGEVESVASGRLLQLEKVEGCCLAIC
jgi:hypothetical protein